MYVRAYERLGRPPEVRRPAFVRIILIGAAGNVKNIDKLREGRKTGFE